MPSHGHAPPLSKRPADRPSRASLEPLPERPHRDQRPAFVTVRDEEAVVPHDVERVLSEAGTQVARLLEGEPGRPAGLGVAGGRGEAGDPPHLPVLAHASPERLLQTPVRVLVLRLAP